MTFFFEDSVGDAGRCNTAGAITLKSAASLSAPIVQQHYRAEGVDAALVRRTAKWNS